MTEKSSGGTKIINGAALAVLGSIVFLAFFVTVLSPMLTDWGEFHVTNNNLSGLDAFMFMNLNTFVMAGFFVFLFGAAYVAGG